MYFNNFKRIFVSLFFLFTIAACTQNDTDSKLTITPYEKAPSNPVSNPGPRIINVKQPVITIIDTCKNLIAASTLSKPGKYKAINKNGDNATYKPPEIKDAGYLVNMKNFNMQQGLALNSIISSFMDRTGNLWFGSDGNGVSKFDGKTFTNYSLEHGLSDSQVSAIAEDNNGNIWFGGLSNGVSKYDGRAFVRYSIKDGLADSVIYCIYKDKHGNLWFGTRKGISIYNGKSFITPATPSGLNNNEVESIVEDKAGNLWFGTNEKGVSIYRFSSDKKFIAFTTAEGLAGNNVTSLATDRAGNMWIGTNGNGLSKLSNEKILKLGDLNYANENKASSIKHVLHHSLFENYTIDDGLASNSVSAITIDKYDNMWFGTLGGGVSKYDGETFENFNTSVGLTSSTVRCITEDQSGNLWFGTISGGLSEYDGNYFTTYTTTQGLSNNSIFSIAEDSKGNMWFGTYTGGVCKYDGNRIRALEKADNINPSNSKELKKVNGKLIKTFTHYTTAQGLSNNIIYSIKEDRKGNLWFGTYGGGVCKYNGATFSNYSLKQGLAGNIVYAIMEDSAGNIWFGTDGGLSKYDGNRVEKFNTLANVPVKEQKNFKNINGKLVKTFTNYTTEHGLPNNSVRSIYEDNKGNLWLATHGGICMFDKFGKFADNENNNHKQKRSFKTDGYTINPAFVCYSTDQGLVNNVVYFITGDKNGNLWLATDAGVSSFNGNYFKNYTTNNGLASNQIFGIVEDPNTNTIWCGTNNGLSAIKLLYGKEIIENYNLSNGYSIEGITNPGAFLKDSRDLIWAGNGAKLIRFNYNVLKKSKELPNLQLKNIKINNENVCWYDLLQHAKKLEQGSNTGNVDRGRQTEVHLNVKEDLIKSASILEEVEKFGKTLTKTQRDSMLKKFNAIKFDGISPFNYLPENLVLPFKNNQIAFDFAAIETSRPLIVRYQYMLGGYDKYWSPVTESPTAIFGNVPEGNYTFKVKARSPDGVWGEPISYRFSVLPPWYRTIWMYLVYVIILFIAVFLIVLASVKTHRNRAEKLVVEIDKAIKQIEEQKKVVAEQKIRELELIAIRAQMNPHFLFNVLSSIQMLINKNDIALANNALAMFGKLMRMILENAEKQTIFLEDEIKTLKLYIELESFQFPFNYRITVDASLADIENIQIPSMIIQTYVENAIKHGLSGILTNRQLTIDFKKAEDKLFCIVHDNGIGRQMAESTKTKYAEHKSMGIKLSEERLNIISKQTADNFEVIIKDVFDENGASAGTIVELNLPITYYEA